MAFLRDYRGKLVTTWQVLTEAIAMIPARRRDRFLEWLKDCSQGGSLEIACTEVADLDRARAVLGKVRDLPMDFADVSIYLLALRAGITRVASFDARDFSTGILSVLAWKTPETGADRRSAFWNVRDSTTLFGGTQQAIRTCGACVHG